MAKIDDNGKPIVDFEEFVNGEWEAEKAQGGKSTSYFSAETDIVLKRMFDIFDNVNPNALPSDDALCKAVTLYQQLLRDEDGEQRIATLKKYLEKIDKCKNLKDLYQLYADPTYKTYNKVFHFNVGMDADGYNSAWYAPETVLLDSPVPTDVVLASGFEGEQGKAYLAFFKKLGYSEKRAREIANNTVKVDLCIKDFDETAAETQFYYILDEKLQEYQVPVPIVSMMGEEYDGFVAPLVCYDFWKELYQEKNFAMLRDHLLCCVIQKNVYAMGPKIYTELAGDEETYDEIVKQALWWSCDDVFVKEYVKRYLDDETLKDASALIDDVRTYERMVITDAEWLTTHGKEIAKRKVLRLKVCLAENEHFYDLSDLSLTDNTLENFIALRVGKYEFWDRELDLYGDERAVFNQEMYLVNAYSLRYYNAIAIPSALLSASLCSKDAKYEERLAFLGTTIAHEISHTYDPNGSVFDEDGWYDPWMKDEEYEAYEERVKKISDFFDGMETYYGRQIDGDRVCAETFSDLMAMQCCLKMLASRENPDYDLFFRAYAEKYATYYAEEDMDYYVKSDTAYPLYKKVADEEKYHEIEKGHELDNFGGDKYIYDFSGEPKTLQYREFRYIKKADGTYQVSYNPYASDWNPEEDDNTYYYSKSYITYMSTMPQTDVYFKPVENYTVTLDGTNYIFLEADYYSIVNIYTKPGTTFNPIAPTASTYTFATGTQY
ncbi:MAG: hypothetical protein J5546_01525, partial [Lachnospiraceae bacterium]|nr:hypothetical protein [Lachnospiraceae bacterium]